MEHPRCSDADLAGGLNHLDGGVGATWRLGWATLVLSGARGTPSAVQYSGAGVGGSCREQVVLVDSTQAEPS